MQIHSLFTCKKTIGKDTLASFSNADLFSRLFRFTIFVSSATSSRSRRKTVVIFKYFSCFRNDKRKEGKCLLLVHVFSMKFLFRKVQFYLVKLTGLQLLLPTTSRTSLYPPAFHVKLFSTLGQQIALQSCEKIFFCTFIFLNKL